MKSPCGSITRPCCSASFSFLAFLDAVNSHSKACQKKSHKKKTNNLPAPKSGYLKEINAREVWTLAPLAVIVVILGVYPRLALDMINLTLVSINAGVEPYWTKLSGLAGL